MTYQAKTRETDADVAAFLAQIQPQRKQDDSNELVELMSQVTGHPPRMWGASIVGFGKYQYKYVSGHAGESMLVGFSPRKQALTLYIMSGYEAWDDLMGQLGVYKTGKACLYIKKLDDIDRYVLQELIDRSVKHMRATNPSN